MKALKVILVLFTLFACAVLGFSWRDLRRGHVPGFDILTSMSGRMKPQGEASPELVFKRAYGRILSDFYRAVPPKDLKYAGMEGMMASLGDPHTLFLVPHVAADFDLEIDASFVGVGARLSPDPLGAKAASVFEDGPAYAAGMRKGDLIVAVDGVPTAGKILDNIVATIRGKEGTMVKLSIIKPGRASVVVLSMPRQRVTTPTVESSFLKASNVGYMSVATFSEPTAEQFDRELAKLEQNAGMKGLVIDLRGDPGGLLETAVDMLSRFVESKVVVKMKFRDGHVETAATYTGFKHNFAYPVVVLINEDSASAAEIFSGVLHDYKLATLVGEHSYGKASVQNVFPMRDGASAKITIAHYFLPSSPDISRKVDADGAYLSGGLPPDVKVDLPDDVPVTVGDPTKNDTQLIKAIELIQAKH